jgi:hypothetical protein
MPRYFDIRSTVLIVVGYGILPEEEDRPGAYDLKREIVSRGLGSESRGAVVVTDMWMVNQEMAELFPAIAVGGPGVNAFAAQIYEDLPVAFTRDERVFIQMTGGQMTGGPMTGGQMSGGQMTGGQMSERPGKRAALWGMDQGATREAVERFVKDGFLDRFLDAVWKRNG